MLTKNIVQADLIMPNEQSVSVTDAEHNKEALLGLDFVTWLPFAAKLYNISPNIESYILVNGPICPSDMPNRNGIGFPLAELTKFQAPPVSRMAYKAWTGTPIHYEHKADVHEDAYGVVFDTNLTKISGYGSGKLWKVMGVWGIDKDKYPEMAQRVLDNKVNTYSMGAMVDYFSCSYCGTKIGGNSGCSHVQPLSDRNPVNWKPVRNYDGSNHTAFLNAHGISPAELSIVENPAWSQALTDNVLDIENFISK
jgi:hypothetical protein